MDSLTHIVLGACIGELIAGKQLGKKALLIGAIGNSLPDIDIAASPFLDNATDLLFHRGITHSFFFLVLVSPLLAWLCGRWFKGKLTFTRWAIFWAIEIFVHLLIDSFTAYGTGLFEPFSQYRVTFNSVFVLDPLFSLGPLVAFLLLIFKPVGNRNRAKWSIAGISLCALYTCCCFINKAAVELATKRAFASQHIVPLQHFTTPTPANTLLWYIVAATEDGYYVGYRSTLDKADSVTFRYVPRNDSLLNMARNTATVKKLTRFSAGYYQAERLHDSLFFSDLRFGETGAWVSDTPGFVFHYCLQYPGANDNVLQRRRLAIMDRSALLAFWRRIKGI